jgi:hypothetical protein
VEPAQLVGGEYAVFVAGERDQPVALGQQRGERGDGRRADAPRASLLHGHEFTPRCRVLDAPAEVRRVHGLSPLQAGRVRSRPQMRPERRPPIRPHNRPSLSASSSAGLACDEIGFDLGAGRAGAVARVGVRT